MRHGLVLWLTLAPGMAWAGEVAPLGNQRPVLVATAEAEQIYYPLAADGALTFDTPGPIELVIEVRRRFGAEETSRPAVRMVALGDGARIMDIVVDAGPEDGGEVFDPTGGVPSTREVARIRVPAGGRQLTLEAPAGGDSFLVRVTSTDADVVPVAAAPTSPATPTSTPPEPVTPPEDGAGATADTDGSVEPEAPAGDQGLGADTSGDAPTVPGEESEAADIHAGVVFGMGAPARGDRAVLHLGLQGRMSLLTDLVDARGTIGWYRIGVDDTFPVVDPVLGVVDAGVAWRTTVVPLSLDLVARPRTGADVQPIAGAGLTAALASRNVDGERTGGLALGTQVFAGVDLPLGPGTLTPTLQWNGLRRRFGNDGPAGDDVRETLATVRLDTAYLIAF